jgi:CDP-diacylglycerol--glycerol-3-phosphate 3-phosphatidyltransferase
MQRPERVVVTAVTALITGFSGNLTALIIGMIIIALFANITAFWRILYCYKQLKEKERQK